MRALAYLAARAEAAAAEGVPVSQLQSMYNVPTVFSEYESELWKHALNK